MCYIWADLPWVSSIFQDHAFMLVAVQQLKCFADLEVKSFIECTLYIVTKHFPDATYFLLLEWCEELAYQDGYAKFYTE